MFNNPGYDEIRNILKKTVRIAVVGLSPNPARPSHGVAKALRSFGYTIVPVRPAVDEVLGEQAYADLLDVPGNIDMVDVFRNPEQIGPVIDACIQLKVPVVWLQDGVVNEAEALRAQAAGITVIMDRCIYRDYMQFCQVRWTRDEENPERLVYYRLPGEWAIHDSILNTVFCVIYWRLIDQLFAETLCRWC